MRSRRSILVMSLVLVHAMACGRQTGLVVSVTREPTLGALLDQLQFVVGADVGQGNVYWKSDTNPDVLVELGDRDLLERPYRLLLQPDGFAVPPPGVFVAVLGLSDGVPLAFAALRGAQSFVDGEVLERTLVLAAGIPGQDFVYTPSGCIFAGEVSVVRVDDQDCDGDPSATDCDDHEASVNHTATEICKNQIDDNCDGRIDEACSTSCAEGATRSCYTGPAGTAGVGACRAGAQTCAGGVFGPCVGQVIPSAEACNDEDDDCDGAIDDGLGLLTCGLGACQRSVSACLGGAIQICTPGAAALDDAVCNAVDDDCDGAVDEDCACVHVLPSPNGNDAMALGDDNVTPFASVQAAIDWSAANPARPKRVCVAAGPACGASVTYVGDVTMSNGVSVHGGCESTTWTQCTSSTTILAPMGAEGVKFPSTVVTATVLDGFQIERSATPVQSGVTVDGAKNVLLSDLSIPVGVGAGVARSYGIDLLNGAQATITRSRIYAGHGAMLAIGVRSVGSRPTIRDNCQTLDPAGRCTSGCGGNSGPGVRGRLTAGAGETYAVWLMDSPQASVEQTALCGNAATIGAGLRVVGQSAGVLLRASTVDAYGGSADSHGVWLEDCGDAAPWIFDNFRIAAAGASAAARVDGIRAIGSCHPVIDSNLRIVGGAEGGTVSAVGVYCGANLAGASRCALLGNKLIEGSTAGFPPTATAVRCDDDGCMRIAKNVLSGHGGVDVYGLWLGRTGAFVDNNQITGGCPTTSSTGVYALDSFARLQNNRISAGSCSNTAALGNQRFHGLRSYASAGGNELDVHSNDIDGGGSAIACASTAVELGSVSGAPPTGPSGSFRNNILRGGICASTRVVFREADHLSDPRLLESNDLDPFQSPTGLYVDEGATNLASPASINALPGASKNVSFDAGFVNYPSDLHLSPGSQCIGMGTATGAPITDWDGNPRKATPDIGADES